MKDLTDCFSRSAFCSQRTATPVLNQYPPHLLRRLIILIMLSWCAGTAAFSQENAGRGNLKYIDPLIGNVGALLQPTRPTVQLPNQMIRMYPQREDYISDQISSFPLNVVSHRLGEVFALRPTGEPVTAARWNDMMTYDHDLEITRPWYYSTYLIDQGITVEFTAGKKAGIYRFNFPGDGEKNMLLDMYNEGKSAWEFTDNRTLEGQEIYNGDIKVFVYGQFDQPGITGILKNNQPVAGNKIEGNKVKAYISFGAKATGTIEFRYAISYVSAEQARMNFEHELNNVPFNALKEKGEKEWEKVVNQVRVEGGTEAQRRSFYTALYRCNERMVNISEDGKYYSGFDKAIHTDERPFYVDDWSWDTYLALHPLRTILSPSQEEDMLNSYVNMYQQSGWMPTFPVLFGDHACMNGFHSSIMFLDAYRKGLRKFDVEKAYDGMYKNATAATLLPWKNGPKGALDDIYLNKGYFPAIRTGETETSKMVHLFEKRQAVAVTLGHSYDDWAVGQLAKDLGKKGDYNKFNIRASNYKNLWNSKLQFFLPKDAAGNWINIDPVFDGGMGARDYYDENNGWTYLWQVQHDIKGLQDLMGGKKNFEERLDQLYRQPLGRSKYEFWAKLPDATGLVGQYSMGNEPSFHIPYLYNYTGSPWKTQKRIRFLLDVWFKDNIFGIPGDEDGGGMTAFVVFSSMGFYPVTPGLPEYTIGSPLFEKVTIDLENGKQFRVIANKCSVINKYIQRAKLNGEVLDKPWFTHEQLVSGGTLELEMGPRPNKSWGIQ